MFSGGGDIRDNMREGSQHKDRMSLGGGREEALPGASWMQAIDMSHTSQSFSNQIALESAFPVASLKPTWCPEKFLSAPLEGRYK